MYRDKQITDIYPESPDSFRPGDSGKTEHKGDRHEKFISLVW